MSGFNGSGTYVRGYNWVSDAASAIPITASRVDADMQDVVNGFNLTVTRDGQGKMTAAFQAIAGSVGSPSITFQGATSAGFYSVGGTITGISGGLQFGNTGSVISGDMSNATIASRLTFQSSTTNGNSVLQLIPNGTSSTSGINFINNSTPANSAALNLYANSAGAYINSSIFGSGTAVPLSFQMGGVTYGTLATAAGWTFSSPSSQVAVTVTGSTGASAVKINAAAGSAALQSVGAAYTPTVTVTYGTTTTIDCSLSNVFRIVFGAGNITTLTLNNPSDGQTINVRFKQDGTGSRTVAWPASFKWAGGIAPILSTAAGAVDLLCAEYDATDTTWACSMIKGIA